MLDRHRGEGTLGAFDSSRKDLQRVPNAARSCDRAFDLRLETGERQFVVHDVHPL
jgi:hypothetical protein